MRLRIISIAISAVALVGIIIAIYQFKPYTLFASSNQVIIGNDTQSVAIINANAVSYEKQVKTKSGAINTLRLRDYVITLKNNSSREIIAYSIECENIGETVPKRNFTSRLYSGAQFLPQTTNVKKLTTPDGSSCRLNAVVFSGLIYEGSEAVGEKLVIGLRATQNKLISLRNQLRIMGELSNNEYSNAIRAFSSNIQSQLQRPNTLPSNMSDEDAARELGEREAIHLVKSGIEAAARSNDAATAKLIVNDLLQKCDDYMKRVQAN